MSMPALPTDKRPPSSSIIMACDRLTAPALPGLQIGTVAARSPHLLPPGGLLSKLQTPCGAPWYAQWAVASTSPSATAAYHTLANSQYLQFHVKSCNCRLMCTLPRRRRSLAPTCIPFPQAALSRLSLQNCPALQQVLPSDKHCTHLVGSCFKDKRTCQLFWFANLLTN